MPAKFTYLRPAATVAAFWSSLSFAKDYNVNDIQTTEKQIFQLSLKTTNGTGYNTRTERKQTEDKSKHRSTNHWGCKILYIRRKEGGGKKYFSSRVYRQLNLMTVNSCSRPSPFTGSSIAVPLTHGIISVATLVNRGAGWRVSRMIRGGVCAAAPRKVQDAASAHLSLTGILRLYFPRSSELNVALVF